MADYFLETQNHEWVLTNKLGGYALCTGNLLNQRKYHGLLISGDTKFNRNNLISTLEEFVEWRGEGFFLDSSHYSNCIYPEGFLHLVKSWLRPYPIFLYSAIPHNPNIMIKKEILMHEDSNCVLIKYTNLSSHMLHFNIKPKYSLRNHHHVNEPGCWNNEEMVSTINNQEFLSNFYIRRLKNNLELYGYLQHGEIYENKAVYNNVFYPWEVMRGYPATEDLLVMQSIQFNLKPGESNHILFSDVPIERPLQMIIDIEKRYANLPLPKDYPKKMDRNLSISDQLDCEDKIMFEYPEYLKVLEQSMLDFLTKDDLIAGFPWFGAWGRDTMISLEAVLEIPKQTDFCWSVLMKYGANVKNGLIPNMFSESGQAENYDSMDATLLYVLMLGKVVKKKAEETKVKTSQRKLWKEVLDLTYKILNGILTSSHKGFFIREDGLIELTQAFASSTWMDAKVNNMPITPRNGAPVEINAMFYNAICTYEEMILSYNKIAQEKDFFQDVDDILGLKIKIRNSFQKFWIEDYLADRLLGDIPVKEYRPNAIIATALHYDLISIDKIRAVYETAHLELFTPYGLRTLSPRDYQFKRKYLGSQTERDKAYHQGTVWAWLLLPFIKTYLKAYPEKGNEEKINHIQYVIEKFRNGYMRGHIASMAEVWDGDHPHFPKGTPAQAWSVAALYYAEVLLANLRGDEA